MLIVSPNRSKVVAHGLASSTNGDVWCLDSRGVLTLAVSKNTYESLGLVGERLPWKECQDTHGMYASVSKFARYAHDPLLVIHIYVGYTGPQHGNMKAWATFGDKEAAALRAWDERRGPWQIMYHSQMPGTSRQSPCEVLWVSVSSVCAALPRVPVASALRSSLTSV